MKHITLLAQIQVGPIYTGDPNNPVEGKQLIFTESNGDVTLFPMNPELVDELKRKLDMSNKALIDSIEQEAAREQARAMLAGGNGMHGSKTEAQIVSEIVKGVHTREELGK